MTSESVYVDCPKVVSYDVYRGALEFCKEYNKTTGGGRRSNNNLSVTRLEFSERKNIVQFVITGNDLLVCDRVADKTKKLIKELLNNREDKYRATQELNNLCRDKFKVSNHSYRGYEQSVYSQIDKSDIFRVIEDHYKMLIKMISDTFTVTDTVAVQMAQRVSLRVEFKDGACHYSVPAQLKESLENAVDQLYEGALTLSMKEKKVEVSTSPKVVTEVSKGPSVSHQKRVETAKAKREQKDAVLKTATTDGKWAVLANDCTD